MEIKDSAGQRFTEQKFTEHLLKKDAVGGKNMLSGECTNATIIKTWQNIQRELWVVLNNAEQNEAWIACCILFYFFFFLQPGW